MTETIEEEAVRRARDKVGSGIYPVTPEHVIDAMRQLITEHRATKAELEAFRREVSEAVEGCALTPAAEARLSRFIIPKPDPIAEAWIEATGNTVGMEPLNAALAARGLKIVEDK